MPGQAGGNEHGAVNRPFLQRGLTAPWPVAPPAGSNLLGRSVGLRRLYQRAAAVCEPGLRVVLDENVQTFDLLIADLQDHVVASANGLVGRGGWRGAARRQAVEWILRAVTRQNDAWIRVLAHREAALLHAFEREIARAPADLARVLRRQLPRLYAIHSDMDTLAGTERH